MRFGVIAETFEKMEATTKRLELTQHLVDLFKQTPPEIISKVVYLIQGKIRPDYEGIELGVAEKLAIRAISKSTGISVRKISETYAEDGDLGHAAAKMIEQKMQTTFLAQDITVERVYETLYKIAKLEGHRSQDMKMKYVASLLNDATPQEAKFILKIAMGVLRLGIADNTIMDSLAISYTGSKENREKLEAAYNVSSDLGKVAETISKNGLVGLTEFRVSVFSPIRPMLAERVKSESEAIEKLGKEFAAEYKLDGERVQIHYSDNKIILYSRRLENITSYYPDIVENIPKALKTTSVILEAEAVAINENSGEFLPFQELMHRRRKYNIDRIVEKYPITVNLFDVLYLNGKEMLDEPYQTRRKKLEDITKEDDYTKIITKITVHSENEIEDFLENGINAGCEGLMLKALDAPYRAGARGSNWLKLKREYRNELGDSLDLVVIGAFFGKGRRTGKYGTLLLATYNQENDVFESICKVGTGFTDDSLDQLYQILQNKVTLKKNPKIESGMEPDDWFEPELVIEIVASEITLNPVHTTASGMSLSRIFFNLSNAFFIVGSLAQRSDFCKIN
ncbi:MAG: ATP-dependent DNA ligase [Thaumarchaeota archaeon]|nr:ATP-dependent DNA ligase [Nitrososphaerota archaeon]